MSTIINVVSLIVTGTELTLISAEGQLSKLTKESNYDLEKLTDYLQKNLTGLNQITIDLGDYLLFNNIPDVVYEEEGIKIVQTINGKEVQGIFYPEKTTLAVSDGEKTVEVPKAEKLNKHIKRAVDEQSPSVGKFLKRLMPVIENRLHSAEDLLDFIEKSDLPLTNDGRIIGYKRVNKLKGQEDTYVDVHSGQITQKIGDYVFMDVDGVDPDRNRSCSHGLHVANLGYLGWFSGSHTLVVLVNPEDFIAVPHGETNKCRVCAYTIVDVIDGETHQKLQNSHGDSKEFTSAISNVISGNIPSIKRKVKVGKKCVESIEVLEVSKGDTPCPVPESKVKPSGKSLNEDSSPETKEQNMSNILEKAKKTKAEDATAIPSEVKKAFEMLKTGSSKADAARAVNTSARTLGRWMVKYDYENYIKPKDEPKKKGHTVADQAKDLYKAWDEKPSEDNFLALLNFKKKKKKSWASLGFSKAEIVLLEAEQAL